MPTKNVFLKFLRPQALLKLGLGLVFLYAGLQMLVNPDNWIGFVPEWVTALLPRDTFLLVHSIGELVIGFLLIVGRWIPAVATVAFLDLAAILILYGVDDVTFRDFGLAFAALALAALAVSPRTETEEASP